MGSDVPHVTEGRLSAAGCGRRQRHVASPASRRDDAFSVDTQAEAIEFDTFLSGLVNGPARNFSVAIVGAGFTGIELALEMRDRFSAHGVAESTPLRVVLVDRADVVGPELGSGARASIEQALIDAGVELQLGAAITSLGRDCVSFANGSTLRIDGVVLATGLRASQFTALVPGERDAHGRVGEARVYLGARRGRLVAVFDEYEADLVAAGRGLTVDQLMILVPHWVRRAEATLDDPLPDPGEAPGEMHLSPVQNRWALKGDLSAEQGETVNTAVSAVAEALRSPSGETRSPGQQRADALAAICRFWLENNQKVTIHTNRPQVTVIVNVEDLALGAKGPGGVTPGGTWFDGATVERLACDGVLTRVYRADDVHQTHHRPNGTGTFAANARRVGHVAVDGRARRRAQPAGVAARVHAASPHRAH